MGEKTEKASPKKLRDARKKGQIAKSQDLPAAFTFIASLWVTLMLSVTLYKQLGTFLTTSFQLVRNQDLSTFLPTVWSESIMLIFIASIPILLAVSAIGVLITFLANGPVFSTEVFKFDIKKFDPVQNLKAKFKLKTLVELLKSCLKIGIASYIIYTVMLSSMPVLAQAVSMPMGNALLIFYSFLMEVIIKVGLFFIAVAVADFAYQKKSFATEMKMEKFEMKQEYKNSEGDPQIKGKRRQIAQEIAYSDGPSAGIKQASAIVTNPTEYAIAIGFDRAVDAAPYIIAMGKDLLAKRIVDIAKRHDIPIIRNIKLAHKLWDDGEIHEFVPEDTYEPLAEILRWIAALNTEESYEYSSNDG